MQRDLTGLLTDIVSRLTIVERRLPPRAYVAVRVSELTPFPTAQTIANAAFVSATATVNGFPLGSAANVGALAVLPAGVFATATFIADNTVRIDVHNESNASYTLPAATVFRLYAMRP